MIDATSLRTLSHMTYHEVMQPLIAYAMPIAAVVSFAALLSEALPWLMPIKDRRIPFLAKILGMPKEKFAPIADGVQLWRDAKSRLPNADPARSLPLGSPTLKGSYVACRGKQLILICVHDTQDVVIVTHPDDPDYIDGVVMILDHYQGNAHPAQVPIEADRDCAQRASLIEAVANTRFGYKGSVIPVVIWKDDARLVPEEDDERTITGLRPRRLYLNGENIIGLSNLEGDKGEFRNPAGFRKLSTWLKQQPRRATPKSRIALRSLILAACLTAITTQDDIVGHDTFTQLIERLSL